MNESNIGEKVICIKPLEKVYTGVYCPDAHKEEDCSDCKNKRPCQYSWSDPWVKIGYKTVENEEVYRIWEFFDEDRLRLQSENGVTLDISLEKLNNHFKLINHD